MMTNTAARSYDYRTSHTCVDKGSSYDANFQKSAWLRYAWRREQQVLEDVLYRYWRGHKIAFLDFACGTGRVLEYVSRFAEVSVGIDVSEQMLQIAREKVPKAEIISGDVTREDPLGDRVFDLITAFRFFPNSQESLRSEAIRSISRHLAVDGLLVFNNHENASSLRYRIAKLRRRSWPTMSRAEVDLLMSETGLVIEEVHPIGVLPAVEGHSIAPWPVHRFVDMFSNSIGLAEALAQNLVYVCRNGSRPGSS